MQFVKYIYKYLSFIQELWRFERKNIHGILYGFDYNECNEFNIKSNQYFQIGIEIFYVNDLK